MIFRANSLAIACALLVASVSPGRAQDPVTSLNVRVVDAEGRGLPDVNVDCAADKRFSNKTVFQTDQKGNAIVDLNGLRKFYLRTRSVDPSGSLVTGAPREFDVSEEIENPVVLVVKHPGGAEQVVSRERPTYYVQRMWVFNRDRWAWEIHEYWSTARTAQPTYYIPYAGSYYSSTPACGCQPAW